MNTLIYTLLLVPLLLVSGCGTEINEHRADTTAQQHAADRYQCQRESMKGYAAAGGSANGMAYASGSDIDLNLFASCMQALTARPGVVQAITEAVQTRGAPFIGICVGMQLLATRGLEFGETPGLDWVPGDVRRLEPDNSRCKVPHQGWNVLDGALPSAMFAGLPAGTHMYFTHSFAIFPTASADVAAMTDHGGRFPAAVMRGNVAGVQFHPEKSQAAGARLLANLLEWRP